MNKYFKNLAYELPHSLKHQVDYLPGHVTSKTIAQNDAFGITLFAVPAGEGISSHTSAGDAFALILEGSAHITIEQLAQTVAQGEFIIMPAGKPHALEAKENFKMLLFVAFK